MMPGFLAGAFAGAGARTGTTCPMCHHDLPADARFCPYCGYQMMIINKCPACGAELPPDARFCPQCGARADQAASMVSCPHCGAQNLPNAVYCNACGEKLK